MLPASQTDAAPAIDASRRDHRVFLILLLALMTFILVIGWGILGGAISPVSAYLWMALACLLPVGWFSYGFLKVTDTEQDYGLLLSAVGWALVALALLIQYTAARALAITLANGGVAPDGGTSTGAKLCGLAAILCLLVGAALSLHSWKREVTGGPNSGSGFTGDWSSAERSAREE